MGFYAPTDWLMTITIFWSITHLSSCNLLQEFRPNLLPPSTDKSNTSSLTTRNCRQHNLLKIGT